MTNNQYKVKAKIWQYSGKAAWYFISIPKEISDDIKDLFGDRARGWGSLPVEITLGSSVWKTSLFPVRKEASYLLPLKVEIRKKENIQVGDSLNLLLEIKVN